LTVSTYAYIRAQTNALLSVICMKKCVFRKVLKMASELESLIPSGIIMTSELVSDSYWDHYG